MWTEQEMQEKMGKIHNIDCLEFMRNVPDKYFKIIFLDQPFGTTKNKWDKVIPQKPLWKELNRVIADNGVIFAFSTQPFTTDVINANRKYFRYELIWDKVLPVGFLNSGVMPLRSHETISVFYKKIPYYKPLMTQGHSRKSVPRRKSDKNNNYGEFKEVLGYDSTERHPKSIIKIEDASTESIISTLIERLSKYESSSILEFSNGGKRTSIIHPTEKPLQLALNLLRMYSHSKIDIHNEAEDIIETFDVKVFDPTAGSGVFLEASKSLGLDFVGCETDPNMCDIANKRLKHVQGSLL